VFTVPLPINELMDRIRNIYAIYGNRMVIEGQNLSDFKLKKEFTGKCFMLKFINLHRTQLQSFLFIYLFINIVQYINGSVDVSDLLCIVCL
jgi:hypothetical protein